MRFGWPVGAKDRRNSSYFVARFVGQNYCGWGGCLSYTYVSQMPEQLNTLNDDLMPRVMAHLHALRIHALSIYED
ncbi:hypothetical protein M441DRAFT_441697 [Trichoderma asperellum CBS 433.97]|uniref:Uncharacterized protein n=1 Tax=Trichoderma asperellum (strain ATCC 204424 / CBS 433.97 / NBRC 101777) TaxID=1042311 RepID=A0A2T3Z492_TRIA4|nr:hypothetical protein M441DRAFT_441697 [Trichoderma asperellum CBS 433.97]PTB39646.1 hypothetical protein M441DRAFT_441697 [Trichoderma asperellum CBS 433.97]